MNEERELSSDLSEREQTAMTCRDFHLEEYKQLKSEVAGLMVRIETLARYCLVVAAGVFSWLVTQGVGAGMKEKWCLKLPSELLAYAWYIPFIFSVLSGFAAFAAFWRGQEMGEYLRRLEAMLAQDGQAWEAYLAPKLSILTATGSVFWLVLLLATFAAGHEGHDYVDKLIETCTPSSK